MKALVFLSLMSLICTAAAAKFEDLEKWTLWKVEHGKSYSEEREELERHCVWLSNKKFIEHHNVNADTFGYTLAMNQFGDMTDTEYLHWLTDDSTQHSSPPKLQVEVKEFVAPLKTLPESIDWRSKGAVTEVKNQGTYCSSSYAFSAMGALEGQWALGNGTLVSLSEQNVIDCSVPYGNNGCSGGSAFNAYLYVLENEGVDTEDSYPYNGKQSNCHYSSDSSGAHVIGVRRIEKGNEEDLQAAVASVGPVAVKVDATSKAFQFYTSGIFDSSRCSYSSINHPMLVIGYGSFGGKDYWLVKNSWGANWGMNGYILMSRNKYNQCGIATKAFYPVI